MATPRGAARPREAAAQAAASQSARLVVWEVEGRSDGGPERRDGGAEGRMRVADGGVEC